MDVFIKRIDLPFLWNIVGIDIPKQHGCFSRVCVPLDYRYQMNTDGEAYGANMHTQSVLHSEVTGAQTEPEQ